MRATALAIVVVAAVWCAGLPLVGPSARAEDKPVARAKWEYRILTTSELVGLVKDDAAFKKLLPGRLNRNAEERLLGPQFALNKLGDDGWELSAVIAIQQPDRDAGNDPWGIEREAVYYLKRPK